MLLGACASVPNWEGMSEAEIADWKELNVGPGDAQKYSKAGLDPKAVSLWHDNGIKTADSVLAWKKAGFSPEEAGVWDGKGFTVNEALQWHKEEFTAQDAYDWKKAGFSLQDSIKNRGKGLMPIPPDEPEVEPVELAAEEAAEEIEEEAAEAPAEEAAEEAPEAVEEKAAEEAAEATEEKAPEAVEEVPEPPAESPE